MLERYLNDLAEEESAILKAVRDYTLKTIPEANMMITPPQGQFLQLMIQWGKVKNILEIGTFTGYSSIAMASVLPKDGKLIALDAHPEWTTIAKNFWKQAGLDDKIELKLARAHLSLEVMLQERPLPAFDLIFVDADKHRYNYYYEIGLKLLSPGGMMIFDNVLWHGNVFDKENQDITTEKIREFNRHVKNDKRVMSLILPLGDGMLVIQKL